MIPAILNSGLIKHARPGVDRMDRHHDVADINYT